MGKNIKDAPVKEFSCHCEKIEVCPICDKPVYLVEHWLERYDESGGFYREVETHRLEAPLPYVEGFMEGLRKNPRTKNVVIHQIPKS